MYLTNYQSIYLSIRRHLCVSSIESFLTKQQDIHRCIDRCIDSISSGINKDIDIDIYSSKIDQVLTDLNNSKYPSNGIYLSMHLTLYTSISL
jgi:hypothetical protein